MSVARSNRFQASGNSSIFGVFGFAFMALFYHKTLLSAAKIVDRTL